jgi:adenylate cyclase
VTSYRVAMGGERGGERGGEAGGRRSSPVDDLSAGARPGRAPQEPSTGLRAAADWFASLPHTTAVLLTISAFLILLNVFTGLHRIWFHWPVAALLFVAILRTLGRRRRESNTEKGRPTSRK